MMLKTAGLYNTTVQAELLYSALKKMAICAKTFKNCVLCSSLSHQQVSHSDIRHNMLACGIHSCTRVTLSPKLEMPVIDIN